MGHSTLVQTCPDMGCCWYERVCRGGPILVLTPPDVGRLQHAEAIAVPARGDAVRAGHRRRRGLPRAAGARSTALRGQTGFGFDSPRRGGREEKRDRGGKGERVRGRRGAGRREQGGGKRGT
eukprot:90176-Rhodomonas_salina.1